MKNINLIILFTISIMFVSCCKKGPLEVPNFIIVYPYLEQSTIIKHIIESENGSEQIVEIELFEKNEVDYEFSLSTSSKHLKQTILVYGPPTGSEEGDLLHSDIITDVNIAYDNRCGLEITDFNYVHNGIVKTDSEIVK